MASSSSDLALAPPHPHPLHSHPPRPFMYKNRLQEFTSRSRMTLPVYDTVNEGKPNEPKFRSTVWVARMSYTSQSTFPQKKAAEQEAARIALESILHKTKYEGPSLVGEVSPLPVQEVKDSINRNGIKQEGQEVVGPIQDSNSIRAGSLMYKNRLQEFTSRSSMALPMYQTINEGKPNEPKFRSTVWVAEMSYTSQSTFSHKKAAEQEAARLALESVLQRARAEGLSLVSEISSFSRSIMNEYAAKLHVERPTYNTVEQRLGGVLPLFISSLVFNGKSYSGDQARTKKEAEQSAAQAAIVSIMGDFSSGTELIEIIKSKCIYYDAIKGKGLSLLPASAVLSTSNEEHISVTLDHKDTGVAGSVADNNNEIEVEFPDSSKMLSRCQEFQITNQESSLEPTNVSLQPASAHSIDNGSSSKKRRKNKKKANKKSRLESSLPITVIPMNQVPLCTAVPMSQVPPYTVVPMTQVPPCTAVPFNQVRSF